MTAPLLNTWHLVWVPDIGQNLQPFTSKSDVSKCVKNSRVRWKTPNKQSLVLQNDMNIFTGFYDKNCKATAICINLKQGNDFVSEFNLGEK